MQRIVATVAAAVTTLIGVGTAQAHTPVWQPGPITSLTHALPFPNAVYTYVAYRDLLAPGQVDYFQTGAWQGTDLNPEIDVAAWPGLTHMRAVAWPRLACTAESGSSIVHAGRAAHELAP